MISASPAEPAWRQAPGTTAASLSPALRPLSRGTATSPKPALFPGKPQQMVPDCQKPSGSPAPA